MKTNPEPDPTNVPQKRGRLDPLTPLIKRHLRFGWWSLLVFLTMGIVLEALHGFKVGLYLNVSNETRRLMWTLAHAHGTLLALVHIAFGATLHLIPSWNARLRDLASASLVGASMLIPAGFFLGGVVIYAGDPGLGILLLPLGAVLLFVAVLLTARGAESLLNPDGVETSTEAKGRDAAKPKANR